MFCRFDEWRCVGDAQGERIGGELQGQVVGGASGAVFDAQAKGLIAPAQVEVGVAPGVKLRAAAKCLSGAGAAGVFAGVVDQRDGEVVFALEMAQEGE